MTFEVDMVIENAELVKMVNNHLDRLDAALSAALNEVMKEALAFHRDRCINTGTPAEALCNSIYTKYYWSIFKREDAKRKAQEGRE